MLESRQVGQGELELDDRERGQRIGVAGHVLVLEAAQHKAEGVHFAHPSKKPASEGIPLLTTLADRGDVDDLKAGIDDLAALAHLPESVDSGIGHMRDPDLGLDRREGVGRDDGIAASERIEEGRFARIGQAHKADTVHDTDGTSSTGCPDDHCVGAAGPDLRERLGRTVCASALALISAEPPSGPPCRRARVRRTLRG